jgi:hypothetical protein
MEELAELNAFAKRYGNAELAIEVSRNMVATERGRMASTEIADHFTDAYADNAVYSADVAMDALIFDGRKVVRGILEGSQGRTLPRTSKTRTTFMRRQSGYRRAVIGGRTSAERSIMCRKRD